MRKTSVYLTDEEAEGLRRVATATGRSQSELIRDGVRHVLAANGQGQRRFHSMAKGDGVPYSPWNAEEIYAEVTGQR